MSSLRIQALSLRQGIDLLLQQQSTVRKSSDTAAILTSLIEQSPSNIPQQDDYERERERAQALLDKELHAADLFEMKRRLERLNNTIAVKDASILSMKEDVRKARIEYEKLSKLNNIQTVELSSCESSNQKMNQMMSLLQETIKKAADSSMTTKTELGSLKLDYENLNKIIEHQNFQNLELKREIAVLKEVEMEAKDEIHNVRGQLYELERNSSMINEQLSNSIMKIKTIESKNSQLLTQLEREKASSQLANSLLVEAKREVSASCEISEKLMEDIFNTKKELETLKATVADKSSAAITEETVATTVASTTPNQFVPGSSSSSSSSDNFTATSLTKEMEDPNSPKRKLLNLSQDEDGIFIHDDTTSPSSPPLTLSMYDRPLYSDSLTPTSTSHKRPRCENDEGREIELSETKSRSHDKMVCINHVDGDNEGRNEELSHKVKSSRSLNDKSEDSTHHKTLLIDNNCCPECHEEAYGLMLACSKCSLEYHSQCAREIKEATGNTESEFICATCLKK